MFELTYKQRKIRDTARNIAKNKIASHAAEIDRTEEYPWGNVDILKDACFLGMTLPKKYGGQGASYLDAALVIEEMARVCGVTGRIVVEANMGAIGAIMAYGT